MALSCRSATVIGGHVVHVGDRVTALSIYDGTEMNTGTVVEIWKQGNGTILRLDVPPCGAFPHHYSHPAKRARSTKEQP